MEKRGHNLTYPLLPIVYQSIYSFLRFCLLLISFCVCVFHFAKPAQNTILGCGLGLCGSENYHATVADARNTDIFRKLCGRK